MKRMLVGGFERIVSIGPVFRARENSALHNPEFSMIEWYQAWAGLDLILEQLEDLAHTLWTHSPLNAGDGFLRVTRGGKEKLINMDARPWPKIPILNIIHDALGLDLEGVTEADELCARGKSAGLFTEDHSGERYEELFTRLWERCECALDFSTPVFITHWPAPLASLARLDPAAPALALRAELLIVGVEIANGFEELTDPEEQRARFVRDIQIRNEMRPDTPPVKIDEKFLDALEAGLPPCAGMALGFERLVMLLSGAEEIRQVLAFAHEEL